MTAKSKKKKSYRSKWPSSGKSPSKVYDGMEYRSGLEAKIAEQLTKAEIEFEFETTKLEYWLKRPKAKCSACGNTKDIWESHTYTPDFVLTDLGIIIETKGRFLSKDRTKMKAIQRDHPELDIRMLFSANGKLTKGKDARYSDWCDKNDYVCAFKSIPEEWLKS